MAAGETHRIVARSGRPRTTALSRLRNGRAIGPASRAAQRSRWGLDREIEGAVWSDPHILVLDPGLAFGTGDHPSTRLCLQWLDRTIGGGETVLDYGCGSGILAIAALKLGARRAVGVDIDPDAVAAARANARRNGVEGQFLDGLAPLAFTADVVVANILANPLKLLAPLLASRIRRDGRLALSGILPDQASEIEKCYAPWIEFAPCTESEGWACLSGVRL